MGLFDGKVVWVTGAGSGIGRAGACMFAEEGATVVLMGRRPEKLEAVAQEIEAKGGKSVVTPLDVSNREQVLDASRKLISQLGRVDILVNNAGMNVKYESRRMENMTPADWDQVININMNGQYNMFFAVFETMKAQNDGLVINISSTSAKDPSGVEGMAYQSAKWGMRGFGVSLNKEAWKFGIRTCNIFPDEVNTDMMLARPVKYSEEHLASILQPEDLAHTLKYVASLHPRAAVYDLTIYPSKPKVYSAKETGLPD